MSILTVFPSGQWVGDIERLCALEPHSQLKRSCLQQVSGTQSRSAGQHLTYWGGGDAFGFELNNLWGGGGRAQFAIELDNGVSQGHQITVSHSQLLNCPL